MVRMTTAKEVDAVAMGEGKEKQGTDTCHGVRAAMGATQEDNGAIQVDLSGGTEKKKNACRLRNKGNW